ncbi:MAG: TraR/DksA family transcriptional regulator [Alphaproteobacteria bacterium]|nr:TraR/DksA family transcriptional regulator [Alphaproteobacteria bacterium]
MTDGIDLERTRLKLEARLADISALAAANAENRATVELDQQSVGRLSRIDAMQQQSLAQETHRRRLGEAQRIRAALARIDKNEFGWCVNCGEEVGERRLALDPTTALCIDCAR